MTAHNPPKGVPRKGIRVQLRSFSEHDKFKRIKRTQKRIQR